VSDTSADSRNIVTAARNEGFCEAVKVAKKEADRRARQ